MMPWVLAAAVAAATFPIADAGNVPDDSDTPPPHQGAYPRVIWKNRAKPSEWVGPKAKQSRAADGAPASPPLFVSRPAPCAARPGCFRPR